MASKPYRMIPVEGYEPRNITEGSPKTYRMIPVNMIPGAESQQQPPSSFMEELANMPGINAILGAGEGVKDVLSAGYNKPLYPDEGMASGLGRIGGNVLGSLLPGGLAKAGLRAAEAIPGIGRVAEYLGSAKQFAEPIRNIGGNAALGSLLGGPEHRGSGAAWGGGLGAAGSVVGTAFGRNSPTMNKLFAEPVKKGIALFKKHFSHDLPFAENKAQAIKRTEEGYKNVVVEKNALYQDTFGEFGDELMIPAKMQKAKDVMKEFEEELKESYKTFKENPTAENSAKFKNMIDNKKQLIAEKEAGFGKIKVPEDIKRGWDQDLEDMHKIYSENPTFKNGFDLHSMLGTRKARVGLRRDKTPLDYYELKFLSKEEKKLKGNIDAWIEENHPELKPKLEKANLFYRNKYRPYHVDKTISNMKGADNPIAQNERHAEEIRRDSAARQAKVTDSAMVKAFSDAEDKPHIRSILEDVDPDFKRNILYASLGPADTYTPKQLIESIYRLDRKHLKSYGSPELFDDLLDLENQINVSREAMANFKKVKATLAGALTGGLTGIPGAATIGAITGNAARSLFPGSAAIGTSTFRKLREIPEMNKASVSGVLGDLLQKLLVSSGITSEKRKTERMELKLKGEK